MLRPAQALWIFLAATALVQNAAADSCGSHAQDPIATDRPQITSSSIVVPCGSLQIENGLAVTGGASRRSWDLPETSIRLAIAGKTELRFGVPEYFENLPTGSTQSSGLSDLSLGLKQQLGPIAKFDLSLIPMLSFPTGARAISSHGYDPGIQAPWSRSLTKAWTAAGMFALSWPTQGPRRNLTGQADLYLDRQLTAPLDAYFEYSGSFPQRGSPLHEIDFGVAWKISPHQQLDLHAGIGLSAAEPDFSAGFGYSVRFQLFRRQ